MSFSPVPNHTSAVSLLLDTLAEKPKLENCLHCGFAFQFVALACFLWEREGDWNILLPVCPNCDRNNDFTLAPKTPQ
jgi:hypothetical protein